MVSQTRYQQNSVTKSRNQKKIYFLLLNCLNNFSSHSLNKNNPKNTKKPQSFSSLCKLPLNHLNLLTQIILNFFHLMLDPMLTTFKHTFNIAFLAQIVILTFFAMIACALYWLSFAVITDVALMRASVRLPGAKGFEQTKFLLAAERAPIDVYLRSASLSLHLLNIHEYFRLPIVPSHSHTVTLHVPQVPHIPQMPLNQLPKILTNTIIDKHDHRMIARQITLTITLQAVKTLGIGVEAETAGKGVAGVDGTKELFWGVMHRGAPGRLMKILWDWWLVDGSGIDEGFISDGEFYCKREYIKKKSKAGSPQKGSTPSPNLQTFKIQKMSHPLPKLQSKTSTPDLTHQHLGITLPLLQMTDPYYPHSKLAKSIFSGYYILFFMYSVIFMITYPMLNFLEGEDLWGITVIKLVETNLGWDVVSVGLFGCMAMVMGALGAAARGWVGVGVRVLTAGLFVVSGIYIVRSYPMYFTDRIFIVVLNWALCAKTLSYMRDKQLQKQQHPSTIQWSKLQKSKNMTRLSKKLLYFLSPLPCYHKFVQQHNPQHKIHLHYLLIKLSVSFLCLLVNNILIVKFIQPACRQENLSFIALTFKLIPLTFYINMIMYYMVMDNVLAALAQITQITNRMLYLDWWNAQTVAQFLQKWCLVINMATEALLPSITPRLRRALHVVILQLMLLAIFGQSLSLIACVGFVGITAVVYFLSEISKIQNNMLVHVLYMGYTPLLIALEVKYSIFKEGIF